MNTPQHRANGLLRHKTMSQLTRGEYGLTAALTSLIMVFLAMHHSFLRTSTDELGHAGAILQARRLGKQLYVGVHSDEAILEHKGPPVMTLDERSVLP